ncbi:phytoene desaturase [Weissella confusa]|uniref:Phytoene desaturase family protein n=1 Tax=Weissella fermenti TaxID=2987699 RepID=A0ABT6D6W2_9LACO|nr:MULTISPECIES: phytoene desaturase family protein [Weissella]MBJ7689267.1 phytoene desaturase [Weissella confusa]MDF9300893.1 phytoene desaturase family protein [Weissella sp. BK2]
MKKVSVVGAGIGGLTAAIYLQNYGYQVEVFEKNSRPGGKMDIIEENGFKFDTGPTIVMMPEIYQNPFKDTGVDYKDYFKLQRVNPFMDVYIDGVRTALSSDLVDLASIFESQGEYEMEGFLNYLADIYSKYRNAKDNFIYKSFRGPKDFYNFKTLIQAYKLKTFSSSFEALSKHIKNPQLRNLLAFQTLYIGISPFNGPSIYNIIPMIELTSGVWFIQGGMFQYAAALEKRFLELGGVIRYDTEVTEIVVDTDNSAIGVQTTAGFHESQAVVANSDFPYTVENLINIPEKRLGKYTKKRIKQLDYSMSCYILYLGVNKNFSELGLHTIRMSEDFEGNVQAIENGIFPDDPSFYIYNPSTIDNSFAPSDQSAIYVLIPVSNLKGTESWETAKADHLKANVLEIMENELGMTDLKDHIVYERAFTPETFKHRYNSLFGATFGLKPTLFQSNYFRPHNKHSTIQNLYFAGASVHPGAGVPIVITSGQLTANEVIKDL